MDRVPATVQGDIRRFRRLVCRLHRLVCGFPPFSACTIRRICVDRVMGRLFRANLSVSAVQCVEFRGLVHRGGTDSAVWCVSAIRQMRTV